MTQIPHGDAVLSVRNINPSDANSVLHNYYQHDGKATKREHILNELLLVCHSHPHITSMISDADFVICEWPQLAQTMPILGVIIVVSWQNYWHCRCGNWAHLFNHGISSRWCPLNALRCISMSVGLLLRFSVRVSRTCTSPQLSSRPIHSLHGLPLPLIPSVLPNTNDFSFLLLSTL